MTLRAFSIQSRSSAGARGFRKIDLWRPLAEESESARAAETSAAGGEVEADAAPPQSQALAEAIAAIDAARVDLQSQSAALEAHYRRECASTLAALISAAAPAISEAAAKDAIASVFREERGDMQPADLTFVAAPDLHEIVREACARRSPPVSITIDESLEPGALRIRWNGGGLDCDVGRSLFAIVEFLSALSNSSQEDAR